MRMKDDVKRIMDGSVSEGMSIGVSVAVSIYLILNADVCVHLAEGLKLPASLCTNASMYLTTIVNYDGREN